MSFEIPTSFRQQYASNVELLAQQLGSKIRPFVSQRTYVGKAGQPVQQINSVSPQKKTSRHQDKPLISTPHDARWVFPEDYEWADLIDSEDQLRTLADFESPYAMNGAASIAREAIDDQIITAYFGTNKTGENGTTNTSFTAGNVVPLGGAGLSYDKVRDGLRILLNNNVDIESEVLVGVIGPQQHDDLLGVAQAISQDYVSRPVVEEGRVKYWMGINWVVSTRLPVDGSGDRRCMLFCGSGVHLGIWQDTLTEIAPRYDKYGSPMQVAVRGTFGATRTQEAKCIEILCDE